ncbi:MAG: DUF1674 domain-containing protein [Alphaproteobacteria bacterium]|nr:DUF1674 domain-containing protein [Alphaproteobacteria bacterium]
MINKTRGQNLVVTERRKEAAKRALCEAEQRRAARSGAGNAGEIGGRKGPDPVRYGDWENNGIASDF